MAEISEFVRRYMKKGWRVRLPDPTLVEVELGDPSWGLVAVEVEASVGELADVFLPSTPLSFGTYRLYLTDTGTDNCTWEDEAGSPIVRLLGTGSAIAFPPSHGLEFRRDDETPWWLFSPAFVSAWTLTRRCGLLAAASLISRHQVEGKSALALAGIIAGVGLEGEQVRRLARVAEGLEVGPVSSLVSRYLGREAPAPPPTTRRRPSSRRGGQ